jgi:RNA polymerase sigma factor (sigma-70 family)
LDDIQQDEDCVQETLIGIINSFQTFKELNNEAQRKYISTICKRCAFKMNEKQNKDETEALDDSFDSEAIDSYFSVNNEFTCSELVAVINCLDDKYREPIMMKYLEHCSTAEIAETLGISENLVYQRISRGKEKLCKMLVEVE